MLNIHPTFDPPLTLPFFVSAFHFAPPAAVILLIVR